MSGQTPPPPTAQCAAPLEAKKPFGAIASAGSLLLKVLNALERLEKVEAKLTSTAERLETRVLEDRMTAAEHKAGGLEERALAKAEAAGTSGSPATWLPWENASPNWRRPPIAPPKPDPAAGTAAQAAQPGGPP